MGGFGTVKEIDNKVAEIANLSDEQLEMLHNVDKGTQTEVEYRLAWARTYLTKYGVLENSSRGVWALTTKGNTLEKVSPTTVKRCVREQSRKDKNKTVAADGIEAVDEGTTWRDELLETLLQMAPSAFERLVQQLLRESGFINQVEVTGKTDEDALSTLPDFNKFSTLNGCFVPVIISGWADEHPTF